MHRSRLSTILIDVPSDEAAAAAGFWSQALGVPARPVPDEEQFTSLPGALPGLTLAVQAVDDASLVRALRAVAELAGDSTASVMIRSPAAARLVRMGSRLQGVELNSKVPAATRYTS